MPPAIDYRQTFLRHHVPTELDPPAELEENGFREEILALDSLRHRLRQSSPDAGAKIHRLASRRRFFLIMPDDGPWLYLPVRVRPLPAGDRGIPRDERDDYKDLTHLLCSTSKSRRSVLLTARSGAGKSTAMLKAFFDCLVGRDPLLGGYLPCYLRSFGKAREEKSAGHEVILNLLAEASRLQPCPSSKQVEAWLNSSPSLLLFMDLNTADDDLRRVLREAIVRFQEYFKGRHRWVIAYRAADRDTTLNYLQQTALFGTYDLRHLEYTDALKYLDNLRRVENELSNELAPRSSRVSNCPAAPAPIDSAALRRLFDRYGNDPDSLISTPLLMHFVSVIGIDRAAAAESLAQLYAEVVEDYLDRDYGQLGRATTPYAEVVRRSGLMDAEGRITLKVAMARVALTILAGGDTRLHRGRLPVETVLDRLLADPNNFRQPEDWWPANPWWHEGRYFLDGDKGPLNPEARHAIREFSFLRRDGDKIGFRHDSFLYYFAALAIRCKNEPEIELSSLDSEPVRMEWCRKAVEQMHQAPGMWRLPALFLGGMLTADEMRSLLPPLLTEEPAAGWYRIVSQIIRGRRRPASRDDVVIRQVERALASRAAEMLRYSEALFPHVYNHLTWCEDHPIQCEEPQTPCHSFAHRMLLPAMKATGRPWLRAETPMPPLREEVFRCESAVTCMASSSAGELITGDEDGFVRRWHLNFGMQEKLFRHDGAVVALVVDVRDGTVYSAGVDRTIRCLRPGATQDEILLDNGPVVKAMALDTFEESLVLGAEDCWVYRLLPGAKRLKPLYKNYYEVHWVAVDNRNGSVFSASGACEVLWLRPGMSEAEVFFLDGGDSFTLALDPRDGTVLLADNWGPIQRVRPGMARAGSIKVEHHPWCMTVGRDGTIVVAGDNTGMVSRVRPGADDPELLYCHHDHVYALAVDVGDGSVLSAGRDRTIRRLRRDETSAETQYYTVEPKLNLVRLAVDDRDGSVLIGEHRGAIRRLRSGTGGAEILYHHDGPVVALAVNARDGSVLSAGWDKTVLCLRPGATVSEMLYHFDLWPMYLMYALDVRDASVFGGGSGMGGEEAQGMLGRWRNGATEVEKLSNCEWHIRSLAVYGRDGSVFLGEWSGTVRRLRPGAANAGVLYHHDHRVNALAVDYDTENVLSGGPDSNLRLYRRSFGDLLMLPTPSSIEEVACSLRQNRIALVLADGRLVLVRVEPSVEALLSYPGPRKNRPPDASTQ
jgi:WD40 repeat protein